VRAKGLIITSGKSQLRNCCKHCNSTLLSRNLEKMLTALPKILVIARQVLLVCVRESECMQGLVSAASQPPKEFSRADRSKCCSIVWDVSSVPSPKHHQVISMNLSQTIRKPSNKWFFCFGPLNLHAAFGTVAYPKQSSASGRGSVQLFGLPYWVV
jgi:hypothetical protein